MIGASTCDALGSLVSHRRPPDARRLILSPLQATLAPQLMESPLYAMITDISSTAAFQTAISQAAQAGLELVVVSGGVVGRRFCVCSDSCAPQQSAAMRPQP